MTDNNYLLKQIGKLFEEEREHTKKMVREEVEAEAEETRRDFRLKVLDVQTSLIKVKDTLKDVSIANNQTNTSLAQTNTVLEAVAAGQKELKEIVATRADIQDLKVEVAKKLKNHESRIEILEEDAGIHNPHKN